MKYISHGTDIEKISDRNITTKLTDDVSPNSKYIHTEDWGSFKVRKNGRVRLSIEGELVRVTPIEIIEVDYISGCPKCNKKGITSPLMYVGKFTGKCSNDDCDYVYKGK